MKLEFPAADWQVIAKAGMQKQHEVTACRSCEPCVSKEHQTWMDEEPPLFILLDICVEMWSWDDGIK